MASLPGLLADILRASIMKRTNGLAEIALADDPNTMPESIDRFCPTVVVACSQTESGELDSRLALAAASRVVICLARGVERATVWRPGQPVERLTDPSLDELVATILGPGIE